VRKREVEEAVAPGAVGVLGLVRVDRDGMEEITRAQIFDSLSWTVPTLVGTTLYARSREEIAAFDLGADASR